jgi:hypothetical protein
MTKRGLVGICVAASLLLTLRSANATNSEEANCSVTNIGYSNDPATGAKEFYVICSDGNPHFSILAGVPACTSTDIDTIKLYQSLATSARLSGHTLNIWYTLCPGTQTRNIASMELN